MDMNKWRLHRQKTATRHIRKYRQLAEAYEGVEGLPTLQTEHNNLQSAISCAISQQQTEELQRLTWSLGRPFDGHLSLNGYWPELIDLLEHCISLSEAQNNFEIAAAFRADLATMQSWQGMTTEAQENYRNALAVLKLAEPTPRIQTAIASIYQHLGNLTQHMADYPTARKHYEQALVLHRKLDNQPGVAKGLHQLGVLAVLSENYDEAQIHYRESLVLGKKIGDQNQVGLTTRNLGNLAYYQGRLTAAEEYYQEALKIFEALNDQRNRAGVLHALGQLAVDRGNTALARQYAESSLTIKQDLGYRSGQPITIGLLGVITYAEGDKDGAESLFQQAITLAADVGDTRELNNQRYNLAMLWQEALRLKDSIQFLEIVVETDERLGLPTLEKDQTILVELQAKLARLQETAGGDDSGKT